MKPTGRKSGSGLVLGMVMLLVMSVLTIGLFSMANFNGLEAVYVDHSEESFWAAEEGLERIAQIVAWDEFFRNAPYAVESPATNGISGYSAWVSDVEEDGLSDIYTLRSTGTAPRAQRMVQMQLRVTPGAVGYDVGSGINLGTQNSIDAPVIVRPGGELDTGNNQNSVIHGYVIADLDEDEIGNGSYYGLVNLPPDYLPPTLDDSSYRDYIDLANTNAPPVVYTNVNGSAAIIFNTDDASAEGHLPIPDGYVLIAYGDINFGNNHAEIGQNVDIYAGGDILIPGHSSVGYGSVLFADGNIEFSTHGSTENTELTGVVLLSENGDISFSSHVDFDGLIFADNGSVYIGASANIDGAIIAAEGINKNTGNAPVSGLTANFRPDLFSSDLLDGVSLNWNGQVVVEKVDGSWEEL